MSSNLVNQLIAANEGDEQAQGGDIFYRAAERIDFLERTLKKISEPLVYFQNEADRRGARLDGVMAAGMANNAVVLKRWAADALINN